MDSPPLPTQPPPDGPAPPRRRRFARGHGAPGEHGVLTGVAAICGIFTLLIIGGDLGPRAFFLGALLAILPVPVYVALALWVDRFEPEPPRTLAQTFAWGATVAVLAAVCINTTAQVVAAGIIGERAADFFGAVISAPVVEELAKGLALLFLYRELKDEFDDVVDGVVYAAMVGLGFAMVENVQYYGAAVVEGGGTMDTFGIRGMMAPFAHPLFTAMFGIGLGYTRERMRAAKRFWAPPVGLGAAIGLHALWNLATTSDSWFLTLYFAVMVPAFMGILVVVYLSLVREGRVIREHLAHLVESGVIDAEELECLCVVRRRLRASYDAWRVGGAVRWRRRRELHRMASELAFHRWRVRRGLSKGAEADAQREDEYLRHLKALCRLTAA
ncbi:MAG TPA: PrsW family intramembrane metalloprotease [Longimicrobium sp.]|nr:PrsW family intramembrane metalloprotease [Longimicrobium sp.]